MHLLFAAASVLFVLGQASTLCAQAGAEPRFYAPKPIAEQTGRRIRVGLLGGYGSTLDSGRIGNLNAFGPGFGASGGYDLGPFYVGLRLLFFLGDSRSMSAGVLRFNETTIGIETGYDLEFSKIFTLRPQLGFGLAMSSAELPDASGATADRSSDDTYLAPGVALLANVTSNVFVGADSQVPFIIRSPTLRGLTFMLACGMRF
jgi:hypothetical protein